jgi:CRISPR-associated endonuclease Csn1
MSATPKLKDLQLSFDVGHSSIGWAILQIRPEKTGYNLLGTGVVTFEADDCLASKRRLYRRQRRHVRSTRQRVARMEKLLAHKGVLSTEKLKAKHRQAGGDSAPWLLAARVLANGAGDNGENILTWERLWDVLRWYAHNRGYDGNRRWANEDLSEEKDAEDKADSEKVENAKALMDEFGTKTFAETFTRALNLDINGGKRASRVRFKARNAAFPRDIVEREVVRILETHKNRLPRLDDTFINLLMARTLSKTDRAQLASAGISLPARFEGGLLFGQSVPRFDNRIISICPVSGEKVPARHCPEFFRFRWAMQLANIRVGGDDSRAGSLRPLTVEERKTVDAAMCAAGRFTKSDFKKNVCALPGVTRDNLDQLLMHPDAEKALVLDPVTAFVTSKERLKTVWPALSPRVQKRARDAWSRFKALSIADLLGLAKKLAEPTAPIEEAIASVFAAANTAANTRKRKAVAALTRDALLAEKFFIKKESGRASYARPLLVKAAAEVMAGKHPLEEGGCLFRGEEIRRAQLHRRLEEQTDNPHIRHRLLMLERLLRDIINDPKFAAGDKSRVARLTIEVNRDLREFSGKTNKEIEQDLGLRLKNHGAVSKKLEAGLAGETFNGKPVEITAGLIRKGRIADDLRWTCPYTGRPFDAKELLSRRVDKDHIIPRSLRPSDSLDSLVITFSEINKWKGNRTAKQFVRDEQSNPVPGLPNLSIRPLREYEEWVAGLESFKDHDDDRRRKKNRKRLLLLETYAEKDGGFLPKDLTQTSQLVRLGAQLLSKNFADLPAPPQVISIPGSVTAEVRKSWKLTGCLSLAAPEVLDAQGHVKTKNEIRGITHLHHALDACVLAYASALLPRDGGLWEVMVKRNKNEADKALLRATGLFDFNEKGFFDLRDLPNETKEQIRQRLAEKRVVQHIPSDMGGLRVEENTRGVERVEEGRVFLHQRARDVKTGRISIKPTNETVDKVVGLAPIDGKGKLRPQKGVRVITDNFGLAILDHAPEGEEKFAIIPWHKVWWRLGELTKRNAGRPPRILRKGMLVHIPRGKYSGIWMLRSVKANYHVDMCFPDIVNHTISGKRDRKREVALASLLKDSLAILPASLAGVSFPSEYLE